MLTQQTMQPVSVYMWTLHARFIYCMVCEAFHWCVSCEQCRLFTCVCILHGSDFKPPFCSPPPHHVCTHPTMPGRVRPCNAVSSWLNLQKKKSRMPRPPVAAMTKQPRKLAVLHGWWMHYAFQRGGTEQKYHLNSVQTLLMPSTHTLIKQDKKKVLRRTTMVET